MPNQIRSIFGVALTMAALAASAGNVTVPNTFTPGTPAKAADVNANFSAVAAAVNSSAQDIATLQTGQPRATGSYRSNRANGSVGTARHSRTAWAGSHAGQGRRRQDCGVLLACPV
jgi:hypothetical protein